MSECPSEGAGTPTPRTQHSRGRRSGHKQGAGGILFDFICLIDCLLVSLGGLIGLVDWLM